jgi:starvation-inducible DNA-binding protein
MLSKLDFIHYFPEVHMAKTTGMRDKIAKMSDKSVLIDIGISEKDRAAVSGQLSKTLADSYTLYLMTHNFHWNVTGPLFNTLHLMFMAQYTEEWQALDGIAERIRALGHYAPGTYAEYGRLSSIAEPTTVPNADERIQMLVMGNQAVAKTARVAFKCAEAANDQPTIDLLTQRLDIHEKNAWMLRSVLQ